MDTFPTYLAKTVAICFVSGWSFAGLAFSVRSIVNAARAKWPRVLAADRWLWRLDRNSALAIPAALLGVAFLVAGIHDYAVGPGLVLGATGFATTYVSSWTITYSADASQEFWESIWPYLRVIARRGVGFLATYLMVILFFTMAFAAIYGNDPNAFTGAPPLDESGGELLFFSITTITTVGLSPIHPASPLAELLVSAELVLGLVLLVGIFGVFIAQLGPTIEQARNGRTDD